MVSCTEDKRSVLSYYKLYTPTEEYAHGHNTYTHTNTQTEMAFSLVYFIRCKVLKVSQPFASHNLRPVEKGS